MRNNKFITIRESKRRLSIYNRRYETKINRTNVCIGLFCIAFGIVTLPIPTGSVPLIIAGVGLIFNPVSINKIVRSLYRDVKFRISVL